MKRIFGLLTFMAGALLIFSGCTKVADLPFHGKGTPVTLSVSKTSVAPTQADAENPVVSFSWTNPNYATDTTNYKFVVEIDSAGREFSQSVTREVMGKSSTSFTGRELNAILLGFGFELDKPHTLEVRVFSSYGNNNERYESNAVTLEVTPFADPSTFTSSATTVSGTLPTAAEKALTFTWTPSFPGYSGTVTYTLQYDLQGNDFANAGELVMGDNLYTRDMTNGEINETALEAGITAGEQGVVEYRIKATTAQGAVTYSDVVTITVNTYVPVIRLYMPGSYQGATGQGSDWTPGNAPEFVRDMRPEVMNKLYYMYIYLPANSQFKITNGRSWDVNYGGSGGNLVLNSSDNLSVSAAGVYRISVDLENMKYDIREGRMGFVGGLNGWEPGNVFPDYAMGYAGPNLFVGVADLPTGGWKMIDGANWNDGSKSVTEVRSFGSAGGSGSTLLINGPTNMPDVTTAGRYRVIWDGRNPDNIKYEMSPAAEMRVVGDGIEGVPDWSPENSPQMTYSGNGVWTITLALKANKSIKFLSGNAWGAFDYEDAGNGKIKWESGDNFATPSTAGTYTITLNEETQTVTIN